MDRAIESAQRAELATEENRDIPRSLWCALEARHGSIEDLDDVFERALDVSHTNSAKCYILYLGLGASLCKPFQQIGTVLDADCAVQAREMALSLVPGEDSSVCQMLVASVLHIQFQRFGSVSDMDHAIHIAGQVAAATAKAEPTWVKFLHILGDLLHDRFLQKKRIEDLDYAIEMSEEAVAPTFNDDTTRCT